MRGNNLLIDVNISQARDIKTRINEEPMEVLIHKHAGLGGPFRLRGFAETVLRCERDTPPTSLSERGVQRGITRPRGTRFPIRGTATIQGTRCVQREPYLLYMPRRMESLVDEVLRKHKTNCCGRTSQNSAQPSKCCANLVYD
jgi:hypothetical protein